MIQETTAVFEDGLLKPDDELALTPGERVRIVVSSITPPDGDEDPLAELERLCEEMPIFSEGDRMTREELHERR